VPASPPSHAEPERRLASVLFADVVGSSGLVRALDPEAAAELLDLCVGRMRASVRAFGGTVARVQGDGLLAIFGAPDAYGDTPARACAAGLDMVRRFAAADGPRGPDGRPIAIRVGIATGHVLFRGIANDAGAAYDAMGFPTHLAAALEQSAERNSVLCDERTAELTAGRFLHAPALPAKPLKTGGDAPLFAVRDYRPRDAAAPVPGNRQVFGREAEIGRILDWLRGGATEAVLALHGPAGVGKTACCRAALAEAQRTGWLAFAAAGDRYASLSPFQCVGELLRQAIERRRPDRLDAAAFAAWLDTHFAALPQMVRALAVSAVFPAHAVAGGADAGVAGHVVAEALAAALGGLLAGAPAVLFLDDAQWADASSLETLHRIAAAGHARILLCSRDLAALGAQAPPASALELPPLARPAVRDWLAAELEQELAEDDELVSMVCALDGSAIAAQQIVSGRYNLDGLRRYAADRAPNPPAAAGDELDPVLEFLIGERLDRLSPAAYAMLQRAAVIGSGGDTALLGELAAPEEAGIDAAVDELRRAGLLGFEVGRRGSRFTIPHSTVERLAYARATRRRTGRLHGALFDILAAQAAADRGVDPAVVAQHARLASRFPEAAQWFTEAATRAGWRGAFHEAAELVALARGCIVGVAEPAQRDRALVDVAPAALAAYVNLGRREGARELLAEAWQAASRLGEPVAEAKIRAARAIGLWKAGQHAACLADAAALLRIGRRLRHPGIWAMGQARHVLASFDLGYYDWCTAGAEAALPALRRYSDTSLLTIGPSYLFVASFAGRAYVETGETARARRIFEAAGAGPEVRPGDFGTAGLLLSYAQLHRREGRHGEAAALAERVRGWCVGAGLANLRAVATAWLASAATYLGEPAAARRLLAEDADFARPEVAGIYAAGHYALAGALAALAGGDMAAALARCDSAVALAGRFGEAGHLARGRLARAAVRYLAAADEPEAFAADVAAAAATARARRMGPTLADTLLLAHAGRARWGDGAAPAALLPLPQADAARLDLLRPRDPAALLAGIVLN